VQPAALQSWDTARIDIHAELIFDVPDAPYRCNSVHQMPMLPREYSASQEYTTSYGSNLHSTRMSNHTTYTSAYARGQDGVVNNIIVEPGLYPYSDSSQTVSKIAATHRNAIAHLARNTDEVVTKSRAPPSATRGIQPVHGRCSYGRPAERSYS
jgi:hypothetical protein